MAMFLLSQAERNKSITLMRYLEERINSQEDGELTVFIPDKTCDRVFLFDGNTRIGPYELSKTEYDLGNTDREYREFKRLIDDLYSADTEKVKSAALEIVLMRYDELYNLCERSGYEPFWLIKDAEWILISLSDDYWEDDCEPRKSGVIIDGERYAYAYSGVAGEFWQENGGPTWLPC